MIDTANSTLRLQLDQDYINNQRSSDLLVGNDRIISPITISSLCNLPLFSKKDNLNLRVALYKILESRIPFNESVDTNYLTPYNLSVISPGEFLSTYSTIIGSTRAEYFLGKKWDIPLDSSGLDLSAQDAYSLHHIFTLANYPLASMRSVLGDGVYRDDLFDAATHLPFLATSDLNHDGSTSKSVIESVVNFALSNSNFANSLRHGNIFSFERLTPGNISKIQKVRYLEDADTHENLIPLLTLAAVMLDAGAFLLARDMQYVIIQANNDMQKKFVEIFGIPQENVINTNIFHLSDGEEDPVFTSILDLKTSLLHIKEKSPFIYNYITERISFFKQTNAPIDK